MHEPSEIDAAKRRSNAIADPDPLVAQLSRPCARLGMELSETDAIHRRSIRSLARRQIEP